MNRRYTPAFVVVGRLLSCGRVQMVCSSMAVAWSCCSACARHQPGCYGGDKQMFVAGFLESEWELVMTDCARQVIVGVNSRRCSRASSHRSTWSSGVLTRVAVCSILGAVADVWRKAAVRVPPQPLLHLALSK